MNRPLKFDSVASMFQWLEEDSARADRFVARFIAIESLEAWLATVEWLRSRVNEEVCLSDYCGGVDVFPSLHLLQSDISSFLSGGKDLLVLPVSEWLRLSPAGGEEFVRWLAGREVAASGSPRQRLYVPLLACENRLLRTLDSVSRYRDGELKPALAVRENPTRALVLHVANFSGGLGGLRRLEGLKEYFAFWEGGWREHPIPDEMWLRTSKVVAGSVEALDSSSVHVRLLPTAFSYISSHAESPLEEKWGTSEDWEWLAEQHDGGKDLRRTLSRILNRQTFDLRDLLGSWAGLSSRERWAAWLWIKMEPLGGDGYIQRVFRLCPSLDQLEERASNLVFELSEEEITPTLAADRRRLLDSLEAGSPSQTFWRLYERKRDSVQKLLSLTDRTREEREEIVRVARQVVIAKGADQLREPLEAVFPNLYLYLFGQCEMNVELVGESNLLEFVTTYVDAYRRARLEDRVTGEIDELLVQWNEEMLWSVKPRKQVLDEVLGVGTRLIWVDALGLEWAPLICSKLANSREVDSRVVVARANLPTTTPNNRLGVQEGECDLEEAERRLDAIAHKSDYKFPRDFLDELAFVIELAEEVLRNVKRFGRVVVTSDHGLSRLAQLAGNKMEAPPYCKEVARGGRYAVVGNSSAQPMGTSEGLIRTAEYVVSLTLDYFSGSNRVGGEQHGGALPEEVLVPVIVVEARREPQAPRIRVLEQPVLSRVGSEAGGKLRVELSIAAPSVELRVGEMTFKGTRVEPKLWEFDIAALPEGKHAGTLCGPSGDLGLLEFSVRYRKAAEEEDMGI